MVRSRNHQRQSQVAALDVLPRQRRYLFWFTYLAGLFAIQILYLALDDMLLNLALTAGLTVGFIYSYYLDPRWRPLTIYWVSALSAGVSIYYFAQIQAQQYMLGNYLGTLAGVLVTLLAFKAFAPGDHRFILMFCMVFLLFSAAASYDLKYMLLLPVFLLAAGSSLYVSSQIELANRVAENAKGRIPPLLTLNRSFYSVLLRAVVGIIALSIVAYVLTPHQARGDRSLIFGSAPNVTSEGEEGPDGEIQQTKDERLSADAQIGIGNDFDLTDPRRLSAEPRALLQVKSHRNVYLRAQVYDYYTGSAWIRSPEMAGSNIHLPHNLNATVFHFDRDDDQGAHTSFYAPLIDFPSRAAAARLTERKEAELYEGNIFSVDPNIELVYETIRQEVRLLEPQAPHYFATFQPARIQNISLSQAGKPLNDPRIDLGSTVRPRNFDVWHPRGFSYTVHSLEPRYTPRDLALVSFAGPEQIVSHYTQLPASDMPADLPDEVRSEIRSWRPISPRFEKFALQIVAERTQHIQGRDTTPYERVQAVYDYLRGQEFRYTREYLDRETDKEMTEAFCFDLKEGYCRHFSSAMAVLCRLNGVPARIVSGFSPGSYSLIDNAYIYRASNAHAWVEVYFDGYGWVMFDPTPTSSDLFNTSELLRLATGALDFLQQLFILDPAATQRVILTALVNLWQTILSYGPIVFTIVFAVLLVTGLWIRFLRRPRHLRAATLTPENAVVGAYVSLRDQLALVGLQPVPGDTARSWLGKAARSADGTGEVLTSFIPLYERAAFAPRPVSVEDEDFARRAVETVRRWVTAELQRRRNERRSRS